MALRFLISFALCIISACCACGSIRQFSFVPSNFKCEISHITSDNLGFLWISTDEGLVRYDGFSYLRFQHRNGDSSSLPNNGCSKMLIDSKHNYWVATNSGLAKLDPRTYQSKSYQLDKSEVAIIDIVEDEDHTLWLLGYNAVYHFTPTTGDVDIIKGIKGIRFVNTKKYLWVVSETKGLTYIDKTTKTSIHEDAIPNELFRIFKASDGKIFVGTISDGLYIFSAEKKIEAHYRAGQKGVTFLSNHMCSFAEDDQKNVWIGSINGNLSAYNLVAKSFVNAKLKFPEGVNDSRITISSIHADSNKNIWVGTYRYWFFKSSSSDEVFNYQKMPEGNPASAFIYDGQLPLIVASDGGGVYSFNPYNVNPFSHPYSSYNDLSISSMRKAPNSNDLYIATWGSSVLHSSRGILRECEFKLPTMKLQDAFPTDSGVWVAADDYGILFMSNSGKVLSKENSSWDVFSSNMPHFPHHIFSDRNNRLWVSTSNGLCCWDGSTLKKYRVGDGNSNDNIMAAEGDDNKIWFLNKSYGLCMLDLETDNIEFYSSKFGLPIGLKALLVDDKGLLWITSADHLFRINVKENEVRNFDFSKTLGANVFHPRSIYMASNGVLLAGSSAGFLTVKTPEISSPLEQRVVLSSFSLFGNIQIAGESDILNEDISLCDTLSLTYDQNLFSFTFACPNYSSPDQVDYYYRLLGFSDTWLHADDHMASFSSLPDGTYSLEVKAMAGSITVGTLAYPLVIVVHSAWWNTWWFRLLVVLFISLIVYLVVSYRFRFLNKQKIVLEQQVASRTQQLADRNEEILKQNKDIESKNADLDVALSTKDKIISVIAHDLRNPLSVITGMLGLLQEKQEIAQSPELKRQIGTISNAASVLQSQMENLLQWARLQSSSIAFSATEVFMSFSVRGAITLLQDVARQKGVNIVVNDKSTHAAIADERMVATIIRNLLANAIKFSYANSAIDVDIYENDNSVLLSVKDRGTGIAPERVETLFADTNEKPLASTNGTAGEEGAGLGLRICYDFAKKCNGDLTVASTVGLGSVFTLSLPKGELQKSGLKDENGAPDDVSSDDAVSETVFDDVDKQSILFVDDDPNILNYLTAIFQSEFVVETASNGEEGLMVARKTLPNIIISDLMMPLMNGRDFCERIKNDVLTQHIPVLLLTASDSDVTHVDSLSAGADDYILKPFHRDILIAKVKTVLHNKELQLQHYRSQILSLAPEDGSTKSPDSEFIDKATQIVKAHVADSDFTAEVFASEMAISRVQLFRKFKAVMATSPSDFVRQYRLLCASEMLKSGNVTVADVAYATGFSDPKYFSSCFSAKFGMSPSQYAKNNS